MNQNNEQSAGEQVPAANGAWRVEEQPASFSKDEHRYAAFLQRFKTAREQALCLEKEVASDYNLFSILKLKRHAEVLLHTPILANLLNPQGSHGQGMLFLKAFVEQCLPASFQFVADLSPYQVLATTEKRNSYGQTDILLRSTSTEQPFAIILENKLNATDGDKQLYRYHQYAVNILGLSQKQICIVYLSLKEGGPSYIGWTKEEQDAVNQVLVSITYHKHLLTLLEKLAPQIGSEKVRQPVLQYIQTLKTLKT